MADPRNHLGVYATLDDVPEEHRLRNFEESFEDRDAFEEYLEMIVLPEVETLRWLKRIERVGREWTEHMTDRGRHHALATPDDAEAWAARLIDDYEIRTAHRRWKRIERFYDFMRWDVRYPHVYNPLLMAAVPDDSAARRLWGLRR